MEKQAFALQAARRGRFSHASPLRKAARGFRPGKPICEQQPYIDKKEELVGGREFPRGSGSQALGRDPIRHRGSASAAPPVAPAAAGCTVLEEGRFPKPGAIPSS